MGNNRYRALVVDDDPAIRNLTIRALAREGFACDAASDGLQAKEILAANRYDAVVTDLRMPKLNGHALAVEVLAMDDRPVVVILTGIVEPRLARDLIARGVDCVELKPARYDLFAAKIKGLVDHRNEDRQTRAAPAREGAGTPAGDPPPAGTRPDEGLSSAPQNLDSKLLHLSRIIPVSQAAFDVYRMASSNAFEIQQLAAAVARDLSLSVDVLRMANSAFYNPSGTKIVELDRAVVRIGQRRLGELALATGALAALSRNVLPWMNVDLTWRRSIAAGVAVDSLLARGDYAGIDEGLFSSAIMHCVGRIALGMLYPEQYQEMVETCRQRRETLFAHEQRRFGVTHAEVMARLLSAWNIPPAVCEPLSYIAHGYTGLAALAEPSRTKAELVKLGVLIGRIAARQWEPWDRLELPPAATLRRLDVRQLAEVIQETRADTQEIIQFRSGAAAAKKKTDHAKKTPLPPCELAYCSLSQEPFDFLAEIVASMGIELKPTEPGGLGAEQHALVNCLGVPPEALADEFGSGGSDGRLIVTDAEDAGPYSRFGRTLVLPASYGALQAACREIGENQPAHA